MYVCLVRKGDGVRERGPGRGGGTGSCSASELSLPSRKAGIFAVLPFINICSLVSRSKDLSSSNFCSASSTWGASEADIGGGSKGKAELRGGSELDFSGSGKTSWESLNLESVSGNRLDHCNSESSSSRRGSSSGCFCPRQPRSCRRPRAWSRSGPRFCPRRSCQELEFSYEVLESLKMNKYWVRIQDL